VTRDNLQGTRNEAKERMKERRNTRLVDEAGGMQAMTMVMKQNKANKAQSREQNNNHPAHTMGEAYLVEGGRN
jgi:hypothetical protein